MTPKFCCDDLTRLQKAAMDYSIRLPPYYQGSIDGGAGVQSVLKMLKDEQVY